MENLKRGSKVVLITILCILIVGIIILLPTDKKHRDKITYLDVEGADIGLFISTTNNENPVLLILGGGPGIPEYLLEYEYPTDIDEMFTVCYMEYRGSSLSYSKNIEANELTTERYLKDVETVTDYLRENYHKDKIYLMRHSFGSYIGLLSAYNNPSKYYAYIAMAQNTEQIQSEYLAYDFMLSEYRKQNNNKMIGKMLKYPIKESDEAYNEYFVSGVRDKAMHDLGVGTTRSMKSVITGIFLPSFTCRAYNLPERINIWRGKSFTQKSPVVKESTSFNAFDEVESLDIPIYFFSGKYDYTCNYNLQVDYYNKLNAPDKELYTFENSAHSPLFEEPELARDRLMEIVQYNQK